MTWVKRLWAWGVERYCPPAVSEEADLRARFFVRGWFAAYAVSLLSSAMYAAMGNWGQVIATLPILLTGPVVLPLLRRGVRFDYLVHTTLLMGCFTFGMGTLAQSPPDFTSLSQLLLMPLLAGFLLGSQSARGWLVVTMLFAGPVIVMADNNILYPMLDPSPALSHIINFGVGLTLAYLFASTFDDAQHQVVAHLQQLVRARSAFLANVNIRATSAEKVSLTPSWRGPFHRTYLYSSEPGERSASAV